jgi:flagellar basal body rod protein FlgG
MLYGLYVSAAGLQAEQYRQDVTANNLANADTVGFKRDFALTMARANAAREDPTLSRFRTPVAGDLSGGTLVPPTVIDLSQGTLKETGSELDTAIDGDGFFLVQNGQNQRFVTRDGRFALDPKGQLCLASTGSHVLSAAGTPIQLNRDLPIDISTRGEIRQGGATVAQLAVMRVNSPLDLRKQGSGLMSVKNPADLHPASTATKIMQRSVEDSGVNPMTEMVTMMQGQRIYEANARMITYQDTTLQLLNQVGRVA